MSCLVMMQAKAAQEGVTLAAALRRAIFLHWDAAQQLGAPTRRAASQRDRVTLKLGHGLMARMKCPQGTNRSGLIERCAWLYVGAGDRFT